MSTSGQSEDPVVPQAALSHRAALLDACPMAVALYDPEGNLLYANRSASAEAAGGESAHRRTLIRRVATTGTPIRFTERHGDCWEEVWIKPVIATDGDPAGIATYTREISAQIRAEERLKLLSLQLPTLQEDERRRIAQDLHDDIGQGMTALILNLKAVHGALTSGRRDVEDQVLDTIAAVEELMRHTRRIFYDLRPPNLTDVPLAKVLEGLCASFALTSGLRVVFSSQDPMPDLPDVPATAFYRLVQEGLNNVVKHGRAGSAWINLEHVDGEVNISLEDDGQGFDPAENPREGMGLQGIRERFKLLNGNFDLESAPGRGTRLYASLPASQPGPEEPRRM
ncbi:MAG TPA: histidine kinase [Anaerolineales bacterium]|nr:histidine kinase [Anaerolineales bacterium]